MRRRLRIKKPHPGQLQPETHGGADPRHQVGRRTESLHGATRVARRPVTGSSREVGVCRASAARPPLFRLATISRKARLTLHAHSWVPGHRWMPAEHECRRFGRREKASDASNAGAGHGWLPTMPAAPVSLRDDHDRPNSRRALCGTKCWRYKRVLLDRRRDRNAVCCAEVINDLVGLVRNNIANHMAVLSCTTSSNLPRRRTKFSHQLSRPCSA